MVPSVLSKAALNAYLENVKCYKPLPVRAATKPNLIAVYARAASSSSKLFYLGPGGFVLVAEMVVVSP